MIRISSDNTNRGIRESSEECDYLTQRKRYIKNKIQILYCQQFKFNK